MRKNYELITIIEDSIEEYDENNEEPIKSKEFYEELSKHPKRWKKYFNNCHYKNGLRYLIRRLDKKYKIKDSSLRVWICGYKDEKEAKIDTDNPYFCYGYYKNKRRYHGGKVDQWLDFDVEDYRLELQVYASDHKVHYGFLFVKLFDITNNPKRQI